MELPAEKRRLFDELIAATRDGRMIQLCIDDQSAWYVLRIRYELTKSVAVRAYRSARWVAQHLVTSVDEVEQLEARALQKLGIVDIT
ncbi:hypothetical protein ACFL2M_00780 [Patescibacteria group bacterium]